MAYTTINKSSLHMNTKLYAGNGGTQSITGVGFQPDLTWIKQTTGSTNHVLYDAVRGAYWNVQSNTNAGQTADDGLVAWNSDGFNLGNVATTNASGGSKYASWNWKAGTSFSNSAGANGASIASTGSINTTAGFSIIKYTGTGSAGATVNHGLGAVPKMIILKRLNDSGYDWVVYHQDKTAGLYFNNTGNANDSSSNNIWFNGVAPTSQVFTLGSDGRQSNSGKDYLAYCFAEVKGYSKFGKYTGNGSADGVFCYTGFKPSFVMIKRTNNNNFWLMRDNKRSPHNVTDETIAVDSASSEAGWGSTYLIDMLSNGFKMRDNTSPVNTSTATYIYMAFGQSIVGSNNVPATAR